MSFLAKCVDGISGYRNPTTIDPPSKKRAPAPLGKLLIAEIGYIVCVPFALVSTALLSIAKLFSLLPGVKKTSAAAWVSDQFGLSLMTFMFASLFSCTQLGFRDTKIGWIS